MRTQEPKNANQKFAPNGIPYSEPYWGTIAKSKADKAELDRLRQGSVGEDGMRRFSIVKDEDANRTIEKYRQLGYKWEEKGHLIEFWQPQEAFLQREKYQHDKVLALRGQGKKLDPLDRRNFIEDVDEELTPVTNLTASGIPD